MPEVELEISLSALENQKKSEQWTKDRGQFIPNPATWLNQQRWLDEGSPTPGEGDPDLKEKLEKKDQEIAEMAERTYVAEQNRRKEE